MAGGVKSFVVDPEESFGRFPLSSANLADLVFRFVARLSVWSFIGLGSIKNDDGVAGAPGSAEGSSGACEVVSPGEDVAGETELRLILFLLDQSPCMERFRAFEPCLGNDETLFDI